jgi:methylmalonyl-CoA carboxyltransferase large subunit
VTLNLTDLMIVAVLVATGSVVTFVSLRRGFRRILEQRTAAEGQLNALTGALKALEARVAELSRPAVIQAPAVPIPAAVAKVEAAIPSAKEPVQQKEEEITPEMLVVLAAAVTAYLGKKVRIRSAKMLQSPYEIVNPWSQQGRVFVQASHNLRSR